MASVVAHAPAPVTRVNLFLRCTNLPNLDVMSKSDPRVTVTLTDSRGTKVLGSTEVVRDNLSPTFATAIGLGYFFEEVQTLLFHIEDVDAKSVDVIGQVTCTVGDIFGSRGQAIAKPVDLAKKVSASKAPMLIVRGEEVANSEAAGTGATLHFSGSNLDKKDPGPFAKSDPYLLIYRGGDASDASRILVHRTETIMKTLNPTWQPFFKPLSVICGGDMKAPLHIECYDWDKHSEDDLIGVCDTTLEQLMTKAPIPLINPKKKQKKKSYTNSGMLNILECGTRPMPQRTFLGYLAGGTELNLMIAIDYTISNGDPSSSDSLHYRDSSGLNQYQQAIMSVGNILRPYDYDGLIPVFGFGAAIGSTTSHCFPLTNNKDHPEVNGIEGVMNAYKASFDFLQLSGPTNFAPTIQHASKLAAHYHKTSKKSPNYLTLLILTDGAITDMSETKDAIVKATDLPLSIIIVGVGSSDFDSMNELDSDDKALQGSKGSASRDIVQFVSFQDFSQDPAKLAAATLAELPAQLVEYMQLNNIEPQARLEPTFSPGLF